LEQAPLELAFQSTLTRSSKRVWGFAHHATKMSATLSETVMAAMIILSKEVQLEKLTHPEKASTELLTAFTIIPF
jgi:hypothetical protein